MRCGIINNAAIIIILIPLCHFQQGSQVLFDDFFIVLPLRQPYLVKPCIHFHHGVNRMLYTKVIIGICIRSSFAKREQLCNKKFPACFFKIVFHIIQRRYQVQRATVPHFFFVKKICLHFFQLGLQPAGKEAVAPQGLNKTCSFTISTVFNIRSQQPGQRLISHGRLAECFLYHTTFFGGRNGIDISFIVKIAAYIFFVSQLIFIFGLEIIVDILENQSRRINIFFKKISFAHKQVHIINPFIAKVVQENACITFHQYGVKLCFLCSCGVKRVVIKRQQLCKIVLKSHFGAGHHIVDLNIRIKEKIIMCAHALQHSSWILVFGGIGFIRAQYPVLVFFRLFYVESNIFLSYSR